MSHPSKKICIVGAGGFGREVLCCLIDSMQDSKANIFDIACFMVDDQYYKNGEKVLGIEVIPFSKFDHSKYEVIVAIGEPKLRENMVKRLPKETKYTKIIHPSAVISKWVEIGEGAIITAGTIITCNIKIGKHSHLNLHTTIGHDCIIGDYFTTSPGTNISGNCRIGDRVYFGTNSSVRNGIEICSNTTIGMGAVVVKNITEEAVYVDNPLRKL